MGIFTRCAEWYRRHGPQATTSTTIHYSELTPEAEQRFEAAFGKMDEAFSEMGKAFEAQRASDRRAKR